MLHGLIHTCILKDNVSLLNKWIFLRGASWLNTGHYPISSDMPLYLNNSTVDIMLNTTLSLGVKRNEIISLNLSLARDLEDNKLSKENKMFLNTEKTKTLLISAKHLRKKKKEKKLSSEDLGIVLNGTEIEHCQVTSHKLLGFHFD